MNPQRVFISLMVITVIIWVAVLVSVLAGEGYESILKRNMLSSGMSEESVESIMMLPRSVDEVLVYDSISPFIPPCTLVLIADDGMSGMKIMVPDTLRCEQFFDLRKQFKK